MEKVKEIMDAAREKINSSSLGESSREALVDGARYVVKESNRIDEEGTPLRGMFRVMREHINGLVTKGYGAYVDLSESSEAHLGYLRQHSTWLIDSVEKIDETRRNKPEVLVASATALTAFFSAFGSRLIRNTIGMAILSSVSPTSLLLLTSPQRSPRYTDLSGGNRVETLAKANERSYRCCSRGVLRENLNNTSVPLCLVEETNHTDIYTV